MNKLNPQNVAIQFENEIDGLLSYYARAAAALGSSATSKSDVSLLNEQVFLFAAVAFEGALSDVYFAYVNKDASLFLAGREKKIKDAVSEQFGQWYASKVTIPHTKHLPTADLYPLLDPRGYNIAFGNMRAMVALARKNTLPIYAAKYKALTPSQRKLGDCVKSIRNFIAHRSESSFESMTEAIASLSSGTFSALSRSKTHRVNSVGAYLKARAGAGVRLEVFLGELKNIINQLGR